MPESFLECPHCSAAVPLQTGSPDTPTCPACGREFRAAEAKTVSAHPHFPEMDDATHLPAATSPDDGSPEMISTLLVERPEDPQIDASRLKSTTDDDLSRAKNPMIRKKRRSKRIVRAEKSIARWESDGEEEESGNRRRRTPRWKRLAPRIALFGLPIALLAVIGYGILGLPGDRASTVPEFGGSETQQPDAEAPETVSPALHNDHIASIRHAAKQFLDAPSIEARLAFVRDPERVRPLMEHHYATHRDGPTPHRSLAAGKQMFTSKSLVAVEVETKDFRKINLALERADTGEYKVDWASFAGYCEVPWAEIRSRKPKEPFLLRALAKPGTYYNYGFQDGQWVSWQLEDLSGEHRLFGYTRKDSRALKRLKRFTRPDGAPTFFILRVRFPDDATADDQMVITEFVEYGWVLRDDPERLGTTIDELEVEFEREWKATPSSPATEDPAEPSKNGNSTPRSTPLSP